MDKKNIILLFIIAVLAVFLRFGYFGVSPPSLNWDEVSHGYNAYSILKTGEDQWGQKFPIFNFRAYGDYPTTLNLYLTIPFILFFGLSDFAIRFPHALMGVLTVISVYFAAYGVFKRKDLSLATSLLVATGPWYIFTSRFVLQANISIFLLSGALALFLNKSKNKYFLPVSFLLLFASLFSYHTTRIFSPLLLLGVLVIYSKEVFSFLRDRKILGMFYGFVIFSFFVFTGLIFQNPDSRARSEVLSIINQGAVNKIESLRNTSNYPATIKKLIYNKPVYFVSVFSKNYIEYFSPEFLFFKGGTQYQFSLPNHGLLFPFNIPFFYIGLLVVVVKAINDKNYRVLLLWILLAPIPASLTNEHFAVVRATTFLPIPEMLISIGAWEIFKKINFKYVSYLATCYLILLFVFLELYMTSYLSTYPKEYSWSWQYGYKQVSSFVLENYDKYDKVVMTKKYGEPHEFLLYYLKWDPQKYIEDKTAVRFNKSSWYWVDRFDKFNFVNDWQVVDSLGTNKVFIQESRNIVDCSTIRCLLITSPNNSPKGWKLINKVSFLDGKPAFELYENKI